ncbi:MAG: molybdenum cofactor biosynthesis protein MoaE [Betaproteobacteria bacterium]|nr:molybdenum cofactor biosynthesis protein MoaE [Betaproteobacteria bacterium]
MTVRVQTEDFDMGAEILKLRQGNAGIGAIASFVGLVRDLHENSAITEMVLEHYPGMTEKALTEIVEEAKRRWNLINALVIHRVGTLRPTDQIVLVVTCCAHRHDAFASCEFIMDYLKTRAPFWKKEQTAKGTHWVDARESDETAVQRWAAISTN